MNWKEKAEDVRVEQEKLKNEQTALADLRARERARELTVALSSSVERLVRDLNPENLLKGFNDDIWSGKGKLGTSYESDSEFASSSTFLQAYFYTQRTREEIVREERFGRYTITSHRAGDRENGSWSDRKIIKKIGRYTEVVGSRQVPYTEVDSQTIQLSLSSKMENSGLQGYVVKYRDSVREKTLDTIAEELEFYRRAPGGFYRLHFVESVYDSNKARQFLEKCVLHSALIRI